MVCSWTPYQIIWILSGFEPSFARVLEIAAERREQARMLDDGNESS